ncbi:hypothetical protein HY638_01580 [Candidatus Woesearchaeota archaeon]|nr:hypothetical protein [Candidatus Woesearchaeota archaeon]
MTEDSKIYICPECRSKGSMTPYMGVFGKYLCKKCGYIGSIFLEKKISRQK